MKITSWLIIGVILFSPFRGTSQDVDDDQKLSIINNLSESIKENYVLQDSVEKILEALKVAIKSEELKNTSDATSLADYLTIQLRNISKDAHFYVLYNPVAANVIELAEESGNPPDPNALSLGGRKISSERQNHFMTKAEVLKGNVGYLKLEQIPSLSIARKTVDGAMAFLANSDAFILDVRGNPGGVGGFIPYLMSYFFPADSILLYSREMSAWDTTSYHYSYKELPGKRLNNIPVYILIDQFTGSAATNLSYTMQSFGKAILVGENTGSGYRGAHSASVFSLGNGLIVLIPIGRVVNAITKTNWREEGVIPDIETSSSAAFDTAYIEALRQLLKTQSSNDIVEEITRLIEKEAKKSTSQKDNPNGIHLDVLQKYTGYYEGGRKVWVENNELKYIREGGSTLNLKYVEEHLYKIHLPGNDNTSSSLPLVQFNINDQVESESILFIFEDGRKPLGPFNKVN